MGYVFAIITAIVTIIGNVTAKLWADKQETPMLVVTLFFYILSSIAFPLALRYGKLTILNALTTVIIFFVTSFIGLWLFKEKLSTLQLIGLILAFGAILLLSFEGAESPSHPV